MGINSKLKLIESQLFCIIGGNKGITFPGVSDGFLYPKKGQQTYKPNN